jgi:hypothetical protein
MSVDFYWTLDGDITLGKEGDIRDTSFDPLRSVWQEMRTRCRSGYKDWVLHPTLGANLDELLGKMNNKMTAEEGKTRIIAALSQGGFINRNAISVKYMPLARNWLIYIIEARAFVPSSSRTQMLKLQLLYDTLEGGLSVV